jgi:hypothetical protein
MAADVRGRFRTAPTAGDEAAEPGQPPAAMDFDGGDAGACPCEGAYDSGAAGRGGGSERTGPQRQQAHYVWMAFLHYDNDEYRQEQWLRDYRVLPTNWLTTKLSGSDIFHCQMFFWNQMQQTFVTFSVDAHQQHVHYSTQKQFGRGWTFLRLTVSRQQERAMYDFLAEQAVHQKPFNWLGAMLLFVRPVPTGDRTWFCSQLDVAALQQAGLLMHVRPEATYPSQLLDLLERSGEVPVMRTTHPVRTKQVWMRVSQHLAGERQIHDDEGLIQF